MSHLRMSRLGLWQRATCRLGASTPKPASNQTRLRASVRAVSFNHVTEEHGRLQAGGGGHGTYEAGQAAGGFHALAASPPPRVSRRRPVRGCPWPPSPGHRARRGPPGAANSGRARHAWVHPPKEQRGRVSPLRACASARGHPQTGPGCPDCGAWPGGVWRGRAPAPRSHLGCPPGPLASHCPHDATVPLVGQVEGPSCLLSSAGPGPAPNPCCEPRCPHGGWKPVSELVRNDQ